MSDADDTSREYAQTDPMCAVYRHDIHKFFGERHDAASNEFAGIRVNEPVPVNADRDAALLSRPAGDPERTVANHDSPFRLSLLSGHPVVDGSSMESFRPAIRRLVTPRDPTRMHATWLCSDVAASFNESVFYPYTSLKYHTLLVAALVDNYRAGYEFDDLYLVATPGEAVTVEDPLDDLLGDLKFLFETGSPEPTTTTTTGSDCDADSDETMSQTPRIDAAIDSDSVRPHRTVCWTPKLTLHVTGDPGGRPAAPLGSAIARSFADVWSRLPAHPLETDTDRNARILDAQLRRIRSWSTALQFVEEIAGCVSLTEPVGDDRA